MVNNMPLVNEQIKFLINVAKLILEAQGLGIAMTGGELWRPPELQKIYLASGRSKTMKSRHLCRLAIDLNMFVIVPTEGFRLLDPINNPDDLARVKPLAAFWRSFGPTYESGIDWGWDYGHFQG